MSANPIDRLECQLESLIEGAFTRLFRRTINARDIAVLLLRAIEDSAAVPVGTLAKPIAPDLYQIHLHPDNIAGFLTEFPVFPQRLARLIIDLSEESGFQLLADPKVVMLAHESLTTLQARITAEHSSAVDGETTKMAPIDITEQQPNETLGAMLHINGMRVVPLGKSVINIGREAGNDIVIADAFISRRHLQLRKRFGAFTLFDVNSRGGTRVNDSAVAEHRLRNGDVITIGHTTLVYSDQNGSSAINGTTQILRSD